MADRKIILPLALLVADSIMRARNVARIDWQWHVAAANELQTPWGERVRIITDPELLKHYPHGTRCYWAPAIPAVGLTGRRLEHAETVAKACGFTLGDPLTDPTKETSR